MSIDAVVSRIDQILAMQQQLFDPAATAAAGASGYANPLAGASVTAERIDQGVDYSGTGSIAALGAAVVTQVVPSGSGWEGGGYVESQLTAAGQAFSDLIASLGGPAGLTEGRQVTGHFP